MNIGYNTRFSVPHTPYFARFLLTHDNFLVLKKNNQKYWGMGIFYSDIVFIFA